MKRNNKTNPKALPQNTTTPDIPSSLRSRDGDNIFKTLTEKSFVGMYVAQDGFFVRVNPIIASVSGYSIERARRAAGRKSRPPR